MTIEFGIGIIVGYFATILIENRLSKKKISNAIKSIDSSNINSYDTNDSKVLNDSSKNYVLIVDENNVKVGAKNDRSNHKWNIANNRSCDDNNRSDTYRQQFFKNTTSKAYSSKQEASKDIENGVLVINEDLDDDENSIEDIDDVDDIILSISAMNFVKAVAKGYQMNSFIFNPQDRKFYWNFINKQITTKESYALFGKNNVNNILEESKINANGWIQPRFFYDTVNNIYIKIETGTVH